MPGLGQYAKETSYKNLENDIYTGTIRKAEVEMEDGVAKVDKYGKNRVLIWVEIDGETDDSGMPVELRRSLPISYGQNAQTKKWSDLANLVTVLTGIAQGSPEQKKVEEKEFVGKRLRVQTENVENNGRVYTNIVSFLAMPKNQTRSGQPAGTVDGLMRSQRAAAAALPEVDDEFAGIEDTVPF